MKVDDAKQALKLLREAILGIRELRDLGKDIQECAPYGVLAAHRALLVLDLWLTGDVKERRKDVALMSQFMSDFRTQFVPLSRAGIFFKITETGVEGIFGSEDDNLDVRRRWVAIKNAPESLPDSLLSSQAIN